MIRHTLDLARASAALGIDQVERARTLINRSLRRGARHGVVETSLFGWEAAALRILDEAEASMGARHGERAWRLARLARAKL